MELPVMSLRRALASLFLAGAAASAYAAPALPPVAQFFQDPQLSSASLSPDARKLAFLQRPDGGKARLVVLDLQSFKPQVAAALVDADVARFRWVNENRLVLSARTVLNGPGTVEDGAGLFAVDADGGKFRQLVETRCKSKVVMSASSKVEMSTFAKRVHADDSEEFGVEREQNRGHYDAGCGPRQGHGGLYKWRD